MPEANPFAAMLPTPDNLAAQREARFNANPGDSFWAIEAGRAGLDTRRDLVNRGTALSAEDQRAITTQEIMGGAQKRLAELVKSGEVDPLDAQEKVITETMSAFMSSGDYQAAQSLMPGLNQIRTYRDEQAKLKSETYENTASGVKSYTDAASTATQVPFKTDELVAKAEASRASVEERKAHADLYNRTDPNLRAAGKGGKGDSRDFMSDRVRGETHAQGTATLTLIAAMDDLTEYMDQTPRVASAVSGGVNYGNQYLAGIANAFQNRGSSMGGAKAMSTRPEDGAEGISPATIVKANEKRLRTAADSLGMDFTAFQSLVIDAAYAIARANDPGGRLSNNDFDFALKSLGAVQDAPSAKNAFRKIADRAYQKYQNVKRVYSKETWDTEFSDQDAAIEGDYKALADKWDPSGNRKASPATSTTVAGKRSPTVQAIMDAAAAAKAAQGQ